MSATITPVLLAYPNGAVAATLTPGGAAWSLSLDNLLPSGERGYPARSANATLADAQFKAALTQSRLARAIALVGHNCSVTGLCRMSGYEDAGYSTQLLTSGWQYAWPTLFTIDQLEWEDDNFWTGTISEAERSAYPGVLLWLPATPLACRYWLFEFDDPTNSDGWIQLSRLYMANQFQPGINMAYGASPVGWDHKAVFTEADGGIEHGRAVYKRRTARFTLEELTEDEAMGKVFEIQRSAGITDELLYIFNPTDDLHLIRRSFLARMTDTPAPAAPSYGVWQAQFNLREVLLK